MNSLNKILYLLSALCIVWTVEAQTVKKIRVSQNESYTDHISLNSQNKDMDLIVKIVFNEQENVLVVSLISYRNLFVFQDNVRYSQVVKRRKLRPDRLPYVVESEEKAKYKVVKSLRKQIKGSKKKFVFKDWITYENLLPQPTDYKMVNDYIEQKFDIQGQKDSLVTVSLRDVLIMEQPKPEKKHYALIYMTDIHQKYEIIIERDPCFGNEEKIETTNKLVENIKTAYSSFYSQYEKVSSEEGFKVLKEMKELLVEQYPLIQEKSLCPQIQNKIDTYNSYVDSIKQTECTDSSVKGINIDIPLQMSADEILGIARNIDSSVAQWLLTTDNIEKKDLVLYCQGLIEQVSAEIKTATSFTDEQSSAITIFRNAERYFEEICKMKKNKNEKKRK